MKNLKHLFFPNIFQTLLLFALIGISIGLRSTNLFFGYPILYVIPDEVANYQAALLMLATKSIFTISHYPPLGSYVQIPFLIAVYLGARILNITRSFADFQFFLLTHEGALLVIPRLISAFFGIASIFITYRFIKLMFPQKKYLAFLAIILICFSTTHIQLSTIGKPIMPAVFFSWLFLYFLYKSTKTVQSMRTLTWAMVALAIAVSFYFGVLIYILLYIQVVIFILPIKKLRALLLMSIPFVAFVLSLMLNGGGYIPHHLDALQKLQSNMDVGIVKTVSSYLIGMFLTEPALTLGFFVSLFFFKYLQPFFRHVVLFCLFYLCFFILAYWYSMRYILPIYLPLVIVIVYIYYNITEVILKKRFLPVITFIFILIASIPGFSWYLRYRQTPTFVETIHWINKTISPQTRIAYKETRFAGFTPAFNSIELMQVISPHVYERLKVLLPKNEYPENVREVIYLDKVIDVKDKQQIFQYINNHDIQYLVYFYRIPEDKLKIEDFLGFHLVFRSSFFIDGREEESRDLIHWYGTFNDLIKVDRFGPYFEIFKIN